jgi:hypothetical protein
MAALQKADSQCGKKARGNVATKDPLVGWKLITPLALNV